MRERTDTFLSFKNPSDTVQPGLPDNLLGPSANSVNEFRRFIMWDTEATTLEHNAPGLGENTSKLVGTNGLKPPPLGNPQKKTHHSVELVQL